jgi:hypothetical protein
MEIKCVCQKNVEFEYSGNDFKMLIKETKAKFSKYRESCPVLNFIVFPDEIWGKYINREYPYDKALHDSIFFIAFMDGMLHLYTTPIHTFLLDDENNIRKDVKPNYLKDLRESWITITDEDQQVEIRRHKEARRFFGKFYELRLAYLLSENGYKIKDLEAWGGKADIFITKPNDPFEKEYSIEVKYIGQTDEDFESAMEVKAYCWSPQGNANYLLYKICDAAKQMKKEDKKESGKIAAIIIENISRNQFERAIRNEYFNLNEAKFEDYQIMKQNLLKNISENKKKEIEDIFADPAKYVEYLDEIWVYMMNNTGSDLDIMYKYNIQTKQSESFME